MGAKKPLVHFSAPESLIGMTHQRKSLEGREYNQLCSLHWFLWLSYRVATLCKLSSTFHPFTSLCRRLGTLQKRRTRRYWQQAHNQSTQMHSPHQCSSKIIGSGHSSIFIALLRTIVCVLTREANPTDNVKQLGAHFAGVLVLVWDRAFHASCAGCYVTFSNSEGRA